MGLPEQAEALSRKIAAMPMAEAVLPTPKQMSSAFSGRACISRGTCAISRMYCWATRLVPDIEWLSK